MVCLGNGQRSLCYFWDCIQVLHFRLLLNMMATLFLMLPISHQFGMGDGPSCLHCTPTGLLSHHHFSHHGQKKTQAPGEQYHACHVPSLSAGLPWTLATQVTRWSISDLSTSSCFSQSQMCSLFFAPNAATSSSLVPKFIPTCFHGSFQRHKSQWAKTYPLPVSDWKLAPNIAMSFRKTLP